MKKLLFLIIFIGTQSQANNFFIVQNLASETIRVYERIENENLLILEAPIVIGKNEAESRSKMGSYNIESWHKFYNDYNQSYRPWNGNFKKPLVGAERNAWHGGDFGWYAFKMGPNSASQHTHGTIGWGKDELRFINDLVNEDGYLHRAYSHGCTRLSNQTISFLRNKIPVGTPVFKIYAKERSESPLSEELDYKIWTYVMYETPDLDVSNPLDYVHREIINSKNLLEVGDFKVQTSPTVKRVLGKESWILGANNGNPYKLGEAELKGYFLVDKGVISRDYIEPEKLSSNKGIYPIWFIKKD